jgi:hypothetical protein
MWVSVHVMGRESSRTGRAICGGVLDIGGRAWPRLDLLALFDFNRRTKTWTQLVGPAMEDLMTGTVDLFEFSLRLPGGGSFQDQVQANNRPQAEQILRAKYGAGVIILTYKILRHLGDR